MLTIAHRLNAVMDSDRIMVMEEGKVSKHVYSGIYKYYGWVFNMLYDQQAGREQSEAPGRAVTTDWHSLRRELQVDGSLIKTKSWNHYGQYIL